MKITIPMELKWRSEKTDLSICHSCKETIYGKMWRLHIEQCRIEKWNGETDVCICDSCHWLVIGD